ncbi:WbqC family protein [bacterium]|nr:WbqC family protein [bacterium]
MIDYADRGNIYPVCYFPPVAWFAGMTGEKAAWVEVCKHYRKQEYTNRMFIRVSNRVMPLTVPVARRGKKTPLKDKKISYQEDWQRQHWRSILFAYTHSPYFEFYRDAIEPFYVRKFPFLVDYLLEIQEMLIGLLKIPVSLEPTIDYFPPNDYRKDYRNDFDPQREALPKWYTSVQYTQVFEGFFPNLSVLDLLCNEGPESLRILKDCGVKNTTA